MCPWAASLASDVTVIIYFNFAINVKKLKLRCESWNVLKRKRFGFKMRGKIWFDLVNLVRLGEYSKVKWKQHHWVVMLMSVRFHVHTLTSVPYYLCQWGYVFTLVGRPNQTKTTYQLLHFRLEGIRNKCPLASPVEVNKGPGQKIACSPEGAYKFVLSTLKCPTQPSLKNDPRKNSTFSLAFVCLFVCQLAGLRKNYRSDFR